jgi:hypothetical protein
VDHDTQDTPAIMICQHEVLGRHIEGRPRKMGSMESRLVSPVGLRWGTSQQQISHWEAYWGLNVGRRPKIKYGTVPKKIVITESVAPATSIGEAEPHDTK